MKYLVFGLLSSLSSSVKEKDKQRNILTMQFVSCTMDAVNQYFCMVSEEMSRKFEPEIAQEFQTRENGPYRYLRPISLRKKIEQIKKINVGKSSGFTNMTVKLLENAL